MAMMPLIKLAKMEHIKLDTYYECHPTGSHVSHALKYMSEAAIKFEEIPEYQDKKVNLWCRGSSGAILSAMFSIAIKNPSIIAHVKKPGEDSHSFYPDYSRNGVNIIIDDFISSGATINAIYERMQMSGMDVHVLIANNGFGCACKLNFIPKYTISHN